MDLAPITVFASNKGLEGWDPGLGDKQGRSGEYFQSPKVHRSHLLRIAGSWHIWRTSGCLLLKRRFQFNLLNLLQLLGKGYCLFCLNTHRNLCEVKLCQGLGEVLSVAQNFVSRVWLLLHILPHLCSPKILRCTYLNNHLCGYKETKAQRGSVFASWTHSQGFWCWVRSSLLLQLAESCSAKQILHLYQIFHFFQIHFNILFLSDFTYYHSMREAQDVYCDLQM